MKRIALTILSVLLCAHQQVAAIDSSSPRQPLKIGILIPLSGSYAAVGADNRQGIETALSVAGSPVHLELIYADSRGDPAVAVSEFHRLVDVEKVSAVFAMRGPVGMAVNAISRAGKVPLLGGVANKAFSLENPYAFQLWVRSDDEGAFLAAELLKQGLRRLAVLTVQDDYTVAVSHGLNAALATEHVTPNIDELLLPVENNFRAVIQRIKNSEVDAVFINLGIAQLGPFIRQAKELGLSKLLYSNFWIAKKDVIEAAGPDLLNGVRFVEMSTNLPILRRRLDSTYGAIPSGATLTGYVGLLMMAQAALENPEARSPEQFYQALLKRKIITTPDIAFAVRDRVVQFPMAMKVLKDGKAISVSE